MTTTPPGWYDDGRGELRWWDGVQWTEHVATPDPEPAPGTPESAEHVPAAPVLGEQGEPLPPELSGASGDQAPPAGYPGAGNGGFFAAATEPKKSKAWIVWVVIGVALLLFIVLAVVLVPLAIMVFGRVPIAGGPGVDGASPDASVAIEFRTTETYDSYLDTSGNRLTHDIY